MAISISIHAPRVGGDGENVGYVTETWEFQSTPPVWGATEALGWEPRNSQFQSTPPVWGATRENISIQVLREFQSTPPVWGATLSPHFCSLSLQYFNPRPPCGGRLYLETGSISKVIISIHAPRVGGDFTVSS